MACETRIALCPAGFRPERPEFGWEWPTFRNAPLDLEPLTSALQRFEPRGTATGYEYADVADAAIRHMHVDIGVDTERIT
jgi:hypothetical protein